MFDKISDAAEKLATDVSRRGFLGSLGRCAAATALGVAGMLAAVDSARAGSAQHSHGAGQVCCFYSCGPGRGYKKCKQECPAPDAGCFLYASSIVRNCSQC
jgi:hypothetical protein